MPSKMLLLMELLGGDQVLGCTDDESYPFEMRQVASDLIQRSARFFQPKKEFSQVFLLTSVWQKDAEMSERVAR